MSLVAWFPLQGDLHNQGLEDVTLTKSDAVFTDDGKIGKCLSSNHTGSDYITIPSLVNGKQLSITYWARIDVATTTNWLDGVYWKTTTNGTTFNANRQEFYHQNDEAGTMDVGFWFAGNSISGYNTSLYDWHHYALVVDYSTGYSAFYLDGVLKNTKMSADTTHYMEGKFRLFDTNLDVSECDVRFFNHCLSDKEVKEIANGMIAHYKLVGDLGATSDNTIYDCSGYNHHGVEVGTLPINTDTPRYSGCTGFWHNENYIEFTNLSFMPNLLPDEWSFAFWIYNQDSGDRSVIFSDYQLGGTGGKSFGFEKATNERLRICYNQGTFDKTIPDSEMAVNDWTHFVVTKTKAHLVSVYKNGALIDSYTNENCASRGVIYRMGRDSREDGTRLRGRLSDFRIYATVLSAEDALALYQTAGSVDKNGNIYAYELKEVTS